MSYDHKTYPLPVVHVPKISIANTSMNEYGGEDEGGLVSLGETLTMVRQKKHPAVLSGSFSTFSSANHGF